MSRARIGLTVLADDLTGACECALAAVEAGGRGLATLGCPPPGAAAAGWDVLAIDLGLRDAAPGVTAPLPPSAPASAAMLKVDSTLRGPIAPMLERFAEWAGAELLVLAPALPAQGRVTRDGTQHVLGAADAPIDIRRLLAADGPEVVIVDAEADGDLDAAVAAWSRSGRRIGWVGAAGLAAALVRAQLPAGGAPSAAADAPGGPVLAVIGSAAAESRAQVRALAERSDVHAHELGAGSGGAGAAEAIAAALAAGAHALLHGGPAERLARVAADVDRLHPVRRLVLSGGTTARAVCDALGITALEVVGAAGAGAPLARTLGGERRVVTKAGRFGAPGALADAVERLGSGAA